jgi:hypothetical protein
LRVAASFCKESIRYWWVEGLRGKSPGAFGGNATVFKVDNESITIRLVAGGRKSVDQCNKMGEGRCQEMSKVFEEARECSG